MGLFELIYLLGYNISKQKGLIRSRALPYPVISVGNLTLGGTGKTPAVMAIAQEAIKRGYKPCVLTRGYKGRLKGPCFVTPDMDPSDAGDEPLLISRKLNIPVVKGADRYQAGMFAVENLTQEEAGAGLIFILDDGYQHWGLKRDIDVLLVKSNNPFDNAKLLPKGNLREPVREIRRADAIVVTGARGIDAVPWEIKKETARYNPEAPVFLSEHKPASLISAQASQSNEPGRAISVDDLSGRPVYGFCALGDPDSFRDTLKSLRADLRGFRAFRDHHRYRPRELRRLSREARRLGCDWIITTEKDIMKIREADAPKGLLSLRIEFSIDSEFYDKVFSLKNYTAAEEGE